MLEFYKEFHVICSTIHCETLLRFQQTYYVKLYIKWFLIGFSYR
jgi:hypothetical protein